MGKAGGVGGEVIVPTAGVATVVVDGLRRAGSGGVRVYGGYKVVSLV